MIGRDDFQALSLDEIENLKPGQLIVERRSGGSFALKRSSGCNADELAARLAALEEMIRRTDALEARARVRA